MSPYQVEYLLVQFLQQQLHFPETPVSEALDLSEDGRRNARERTPRPLPPKRPGWIGPGQVFEVVADQTPLDPVIDYEKQRRAARFLSTAKLPLNPLPPFQRVKDHVGASQKKQSKVRPQAIPTVSTMESTPGPVEEEPMPLMLEPEGLEEEMVDLGEEAQKTVEVEAESPPTKEEDEKVAKKEASLEIEEDKEEEEKTSKKKPTPTAAQLLDFEDEEEEDFDDDDGLSAEETDEADVVFGNEQITQASMIKFMHQYPDSVLKFLLRRNLDGRPLPSEFEKIYEQWQERGLLRGRLKRHLLRMMEWKEIPDLPVHELVGQIRTKILDLRHQDE